MLWMTLEEFVRKGSNLAGCLGCLITQTPFYTNPLPVSACWHLRTTLIKQGHYVTQAPPSHLLFHFFGAEVQVSVADPLDFKPIFVAVVATALELNLEHVNGLLHEASPGGVCVPVELHAVLEPLGQGALQGAPHEKANQSNEENEHVKDAAQCQVRFQHRLPLGKFSGIQRVVTNLSSKTVEGAG